MVANAKSFMFWITNPEWYDYDENEKPYLTEKAPEEAKRSFEEYLKLIEREEKTSIKFV